MFLFQNVLLIATTESIKFDGRALKLGSGSIPIPRIEASPITTATTTIITAGTDNTETIVEKDATDLNYGSHSTSESNNKIQRQLQSGTIVATAAVTAVSTGSTITSSEASTPQSSPPATPLNSLPPSPEKISPTSSASTIAPNQKSPTTGCKVQSQNQDDSPQSSLLPPNFTDYGQKATAVALSILIGQQQQTQAKKTASSGQLFEALSMPPPPQDSPQIELAPRKRRRKRNDPQSCLTNSEVRPLRKKGHS